MVVADTLRGERVVIVKPFRYVFSLTSIAYAIAYVDSLQEKAHTLLHSNTVCMHTREIISYTHSIELSAKDKTMT